LDRMSAHHAGDTGLRIAVWRLSTSGERARVAGAMHHVSSSDRPGEPIGDASDQRTFGASGCTPFQAIGATTDNEVAGEPSIRRVVRAT
jgi:hypothetical protein